ncbi:MAG: hypothetical protein H7067_02070 [Burkholderiales bacterium]|nr:hypothetical protein [Opitutaceae bacterium]
MNTPYKRPVVATIYRVLALLCLVVAGAALLASIVDGGRRQPVAPALGCALALWAIASGLDYLARAAHHAERSADALERIEWASGAPAREAAQKEKNESAKAEAARWQAAQE